MKHDYCVACGNVDNLQQHHLFPKSLGGSDEDSNLITLCGKCHGRLHAKRLDVSWKKCQREGIDKALAKGVKFGAKPKLSEDDKQRILVCFETGESVVSISEEYKLSRQTIYNVIKNTKRRTFKELLASKP